MQSVLAQSRTFANNRIFARCEKPVIFVSTYLAVKRLIIEWSCFWHIDSSGSQVEYKLSYLMLFFDKPTWNIHPAHIVSLLNGNGAIPSRSIPCAYIMAILLDNQVDWPYLNKTNTHATARNFDTNIKTSSTRTLGHDIAAAAILRFLFTINSLLCLRSPTSLICSRGTAKM